MPAASLDILYEDNHLLVLNKPAGLAAMGVTLDVPSLITLAKHYLKHKYHKPGNVYLGVVSRLDAVASGVTLFARTSKAAARLTEQFRSREVAKTYWAIAQGRVQPPAGEWTDWLAKDEAAQRMFVSRSSARDAKEARLSYRTLRPLAENTLVEIQLETGRKHQIRVQLSSRGFPIVGDRKYGSHVRFKRGAGGNPEGAIALHARRLALKHPVRGDALEFVARLPQTWRTWGVTETE